MFSANSLAAASQRTGLGFASRPSAASQHQMKELNLFECCRHSPASLLISFIHSRPLAERAASLKPAARSLMSHTSAHMSRVAARNCHMRKRPSGATSMSLRGEFQLSRALSRVYTIESDKQRAREPAGAPATRPHSLTYRRRPRASLACASGALVCELECACVQSSDSPDSCAHKLLNSIDTRRRAAAD